MKKVDYEKFECESAKPASGREKNLAKKFGLRNPIAVPIRTKGLSSQGDRKSCLPNVIKMAHRYGGQLLVGWVYRETPEGFSDDLMRHAVWVTPEGRAVCVTHANYIRAGGYQPDASIVNSKGELCVSFYPTAVYSQSEIVSMIENGEGKLQWGATAVFKYKGVIGCFKTVPKTLTVSDTPTRVNQNTVKNIMSRELPVGREFMNLLKSHGRFLPPVFA
jgi:hypothetical protein